jgi:hypothetical protein
MPTKAKAKAEQAERDQVIADEAAAEERSVAAEVADKPTPSAPGTTCIYCGRTMPQPKGE